MEKKAKFDINDIKSIQFNLLDIQVDLVLKALLFYKYNLEYVADVFANSGEERQTELAKVTYTYEQIFSYKAEQLYSKDKKINRICAKEINDVDTSNMLNIKLNSTEEKILNLINREKYITQAEISKLLNFSPNCIYKNLRNLKAKGIVERIGSNKNGYWKILK